MVITDITMHLFGHNGQLEVMLLPSLFFGCMNSLKLALAVIPINMSPKLARDLDPSIAFVF